MMRITTKTDNTHIFLNLITVVFLEGKVEIKHSSCVSQTKCNTSSSFMKVDYYHLCNLQTYMEALSNGNIFVSDSRFADGP